MNFTQLQKSTKNLKVLYVEDSLTIRKATLKILSHYFEYIESAVDGEEAFSLYDAYYTQNNSYFDIVITDLEMPKMDGEELSKLILDFNEKQEIVVISGVNDFKKVVQLINIGINKFISKPIEEQQLNEVLLKVIQNIRKKQLQENENLEITEYNNILQERENEHKEVLQSKIKELEEFSHALSISAIVSKTDTKGIITYVNEQFCHVCGYSKEELIGKNNNILNSGTKSKSFFQRLWNTINNKKSYKTLFENRHKDGSLFYIETTISPILNTEGEIVEFIAVSHDMTQLMNSLATAKRAKQAKEDFFINISHEMKTPLNAILGFSSLLQKRVASDEKSSMMLHKIQETGSDLKNLVDSILDIRTIQDNKLTLKDEVFTPLYELNKSIEKYTKKANIKHQEYQYFIDTNLPESLIGDASRMRQVLEILLDNAIKFTPNEGKIHVTIFYDNISKKLICEVKDNGVGIDKKDQSKIFDTQQVETSLNRSHEGAGLGLHIAFNILKIMNSTISLKSIPQKGSLFKVEFSLLPYSTKE